VKSYTIHCHSTSLGWLEVNKGQRTLIKTVFLDNGLETKVIESRGKKVLSVRNNYFKNGLLHMAEVRYYKPRSIEKFYYQYDSLSFYADPISVKGYKDGKLIYSESRFFVKDTLETNKHYINVNFINAKERTVTFFSADSLVKSSIEYRDNSPGAYYSFIRYSPIRQIIEQVDSSADSYSRTTFLYDSTGRLMVETYSGMYQDIEPYIVTYTYDSLGRIKGEINSKGSRAYSLVYHDYFFRENKTIEYSLGSNGMKDTIGIVAKRFDNEGNLIFKEEIDFSNNIINKSSKELVTTYQYWMYDKDRIVKYSRRNGDDAPIITYDVTYQE
jgi:hypothetical protein